MTRNFGTIKKLLDFLDAFREATGTRISWEKGTELDIIPESPLAYFFAGWERRYTTALKNCACRDCGKDTFPFMVKNPVWTDEAKLAKGIVCWDCLEKRIGRPLTPDDLTDVGANIPILKGVEMGRKERRTAFVCAHCGKTVSLPENLGKPLEELAVGKGWHLEEIDKEIVASCPECHDAVMGGKA